MAAQPTASSSTSTIGDLTLRGMPLWVQDTVATAAVVVTDTVATAAAVVTDATVGRYHTALLVIYVAVLLSGVAGLALALRALRSHALSVTTIAVLNLVFAHFLFLVTLPFRIYYYAADRWPLSAGWCKAVSSMIHIHLYMCFVFYVVILVTRLLSFHRRRGEAATVEFQRRTHAILVSVAVWTTAHPVWDWGLRVPLKPSCCSPSTGFDGVPVAFIVPAGRESKRLTSQAHSSGARRKSHKRESQQSLPPPAIVGIMLEKDNIDTNLRYSDEEYDVWTGSS